MPTKFVELAIKRGVIGHVLGLKKSKVVRYRFKWPILEDIRKVFVQTAEDDLELTDYYEKYIHKDMTTMEKAKAIALAVNSRIKYSFDIDNWGKTEYWASPIEAHRKKVDDCDGYAVLIVYLLRLFGAKSYEVFVRAGYVFDDRGNKIGHAHPVIVDIETLQFYPLEGSFYPSRALKNFGKIPIQDNPIYRGKTWFITNDQVSYADYPWLRFVR